jgi:hypothetical protein
MKEDNLDEKNIINKELNKNEEKEEEIDEEKLKILTDNINNPTLKDKYFDRQVFYF